MARAGSRKRFCRGGIATAILLCGIAGNAHAQVITDGSLGPRVTLTGPNFQVFPSLGRSSGQNLFHSFSTLTIRSGQSVQFFVDANTRNVISRVTGGVPSTIDGQIRNAVQNVNLFLINPNGIVFGPTASLNVAGSFYASTSDYVMFNDGSRFNSLPRAGVAEEFPIATPSGFGFLGQVTDIALNGAQLRVNEGNALGLYGGNLRMTNSGTRVSVVSAPSGAVALVAAGAGEVGLDGRFTSGAPVGRLELLGGTLVAVNEGVKNTGSGRLVIRGGDVFIDHSRVLSQTKNGNGGEIDIEASSLLWLNKGEVNAVTTGKGNAANVKIRATDVLLEDASLVDTSCDPGCTSGRGGELVISASRSLIARNDAINSPLFVVSNTFGGGATGRVTINTPSMLLAGNSSVQAVTVAAGSSSGLTLNVGSLTLTGGAQVDTSSRGAGAGGALTVNASGGIVISGLRQNSSNAAIPSGLFSNANAEGNAGTIQVSAANLSVLAGGEISSSAARNSSGNGGEIGISVTGDLTISGQGALSYPDAPDSVKRSSIVSNTFSSGRAGVTTISADRLIVSDNGLMQAQSEGTGDAGNIVFRGGELTIRSGGQISSDNRATGVGGSVDISATRSIDISGANSGLFSKTYGPAVGGAVFVRAPEIRLSERGGIYATTDGKGNSSSIEVIASRNLSMTGGSVIQANTTLSGDAGRILVQAGDTITIDGSTVSTISGAAGAAGRIDVRGGDLVITNGGRITSDTFLTGAGGSIDIAMSRGVKVSGKDIKTGIRSGIFAKTYGSAAGGSIAIRSSGFELADGAGLFVTTEGTGKGGSIDVTANQSILFTGGAVVEAASTAKGDAGNIVIRAGANIEIDQSRVSSSARFADGGNVAISAKGRLLVSEGSIATEVGTGLGNGGNVLINSNILALQNAVVSANAFGGDGGNINIVSENILSSSESKVTASSQLGIDGTVTFSSPAVDLSGALFSVSASFLDANAVLAARCVAPTQRARSSLALRTFDPDYRDETGFLFPRTVAVAPRNIASVAWLNR